MGWFLRKPGSGKGGSRRAGRVARKDDRPPREIAWSRVVLALRALVVVGVVVGAVFGWGRGVAWLEHRVAAQRARSVAAEGVHLEGLPASLEPVIGPSLRASIAGALDANPLSADSLARVTSMLESDPWVKQVKQVRRTATGVDVEATYRLPFAVAQSPDGRFCLVDREGFVLRDDYRARHAEYLRGRSKLAVISRVPDPAPGPGERWASEALAGAIALAAEVSDEAFAGQIEVYDAGGQWPNGEQRLRMLTRSGGEVYWGSAPGHEQVMEHDPATKINWLRRIDHESLGSIDAHGHVVYLDMGNLAIRSASHATGN